MMLMDCCWCFSSNLLKHQHAELPLSHLQSNSVPVVQHPHMTHLRPLLSYSPEAFSPQRASPGFSPEPGKQLLLLASCCLLPVACFLLAAGFFRFPASRFLLPAFSFLLPTFCSLLPAASCQTHLDQVVSPL